MLISFIAIPPAHHCRPDNGSTLAASVPMSADGTTVTDACHQYEVTGDNRSALVDCRNGFEFVVDEHGPTMASDYGLACGHGDVLVELSGSSLNVGKMLGGFVLMSIADRYGRQVVLNWSMLGVGVMTCLSAFMPGPYSYCASRLLAGFFLRGVMTTNLTMAAEYFVGAARKWSMMIGSMGWAIGMLLLALMAHLLRNWRHLHLAIGLPCLLFVSYFWILPESVHWLMATGKRERLQRSVRRLARTNRCSEEITKRMLHLADLGIEQSGRVSEAKDGWLAMLLGPFHILRYRFLWKRTAIVALHFWVNSIVYYGLTFLSVTWSGDRYLNYAMSAIIEVPASIAGAAVLKIIGRRSGMIFSFLGMAFAGFAGFAVSHWAGKLL